MEKGKEYFGGRIQSDTRNLGSCAFFFITLVQKEYSVEILSAPFERKDLSVDLAEC